MCRRSIADVIVAGVGVSTLVDVDRIGAATAVPSGVPHCEQKRASGEASAPHVGQRGAMAVPH
jgi:hypothetical protein